MLAFLVAASMIVILMFLLSFTIATAQDIIVRAVRARLGDVKRSGGWILIGVGAWFLILAIFAEFFTRIFPV
jgi:hypothetical protein